MHKDKILSVVPAVGQPLRRRTPSWKFAASALVGLVGLSMLVAGCSGSSSSTDNSASGGGTASTGKKLQIAVIPKGATHDYWKALHAGAEAGAKEAGCDIIWRGPDKEDDRDSQITTVQNFVSSKVDGIVLAPLDDSALVAPVKDAKAANIPVLVVDSPLKGDLAISTVATDNEKGGEMAGDALGKLLNGKGKVVMLRYEQGSASTDLREKGFLEAIAKYPGIQVVSDNQYGGVTAESAQKASENLLSNYKSGSGLTIDGIFCPNESTAEGMLKVLEDDQVAGKVKFVGFDSSKPLIDGLTKKEINALVVQNPFKMGELAVKMMVDAIHGKAPEKNVDTGATVVTPDNLSQPDIQKLVNPPAPE